MTTPADLRQRAKEATPGPWRNEGRFVSALKIKVVAEVPEGGIYHGKVDAANTRLIALAPDLALALADAWEALNQTDNDFRDIAYSSPNWMELDAVANHSRRCNELARRAQELTSAVLAKLEGLEAGGKS